MSADFIFFIYARLKSCLVCVHYLCLIDSVSELLKMCDILSQNIIVCAFFPFAASCDILLRLFCYTCFYYVLHAKIYMYILYDHLLWIYSYIVFKYPSLVLLTKNILIK